jgi:hypothetical protein
MQLSRYIPIVAKILTGILVIMTIVGYLLILVPNDFVNTKNITTPNRLDGMFDTY